MCRMVEGMAGEISRLPENYRCLYVLMGGLFLYLYGIVGHKMPIVSRKQ